MSWRVEIQYLRVIYDTFGEVGLSPSEYHRVLSAVTLDVNLTDDDGFTLRGTARLTEKEIASLQPFLESVEARLKEKLKERPPTGTGL